LISFEVIAELADLHLDDPAQAAEGMALPPRRSVVSARHRETRRSVMRYLFVYAISLIFLFLWSKLPDPAGPQPETLNSLPDRESNDMQSAKTGEARGAKLHPDELGEPDDHGRIRVLSDGDVQGGADGRAPITATAILFDQRVRGTYADGDRRVPAATAGSAAGLPPPGGAVRPSPARRPAREDNRYARKGSETMNCPRCGNDQWGKSRDSFGREDIVCVNCGLPGQSAIEALVHDWVTNHEPPEATILAGCAFQSAE
jgi:hypothetical protein